MALYPSLEDMKVDQLMKAQLQSEPFINVDQPAVPSAPRLSELVNDDDLSFKYPALNDYMGLELTRDVIAANMPEYLDSPRNMPMVARDSSADVNRCGGLIAPLSGQSSGLKKAFVTNGIRQVILCKDAEGKIGLKLLPINNGIFVNLVIKNSPAAMAGIRFGDQILEINGKTLAGLKIDAVNEIIKKAPSKGISFFIRDRPFERTVTLHKDSTGHIGFSYSDGKITQLVIDSSAARNGLLTDHNLLEVNGQNVVGLNDKKISKIISEGGDVITVTIVPSFIYHHMTKRMPFSSLKHLMDHSVPTF